MTMTMMMTMRLGVLWPLGAFVDPAFAPRFQWQLLAIGRVAGRFETIGWTGFATPRLLVRHRWVTAGLLHGLVWALRHVLVDFRQSFNAMGHAGLLEFAILCGATWTADRLLITWVDAKTHSLLLAVLMQTSETGWLFVLYPAMSCKQGLVWQTALAAALWPAVTAVLTGLARQRPCQCACRRCRGW